MKNSDEFKIKWDHKSTSCCQSSTPVASWMQTNWILLCLTTQGHFVCPGGPADGRLVPGDQLVKINNVAVDDLTPEQAAEIIRSTVKAAITHPHTHIRMHAWLSVHKSLCALYNWAMHITSKLAIWPLLFFLGSLRIHWQWLSSERCWWATTNTYTHAFLMGTNTFTHEVAVMVS